MYVRTTLSGKQQLAYAGHMPHPFMCMIVLQARQLRVICISKPSIKASSWAALFTSARRCMEQAKCASQALAPAARTGPTLQARSMLHSSRQKVRDFQEHQMRPLESGFLFSAFPPVLLTILQLELACFCSMVPRRGREHQTAISHWGDTPHLPCQRPSRTALSLAHLGELLCDGQRNTVPLAAQVLENAGPGGFLVLQGAQLLFMQCHLKRQSKMLTFNLLTTWRDPSLNELQHHMKRQPMFVWTAAPPLMRWPWIWNRTKLDCLSWRAWPSRHMEAYLNGRAVCCMSEA